MLRIETGSVLPSGGILTTSRPRRYLQRSIFSETYPLPSHRRPPMPTDRSNRLNHPHQGCCKVALASSSRDGVSKASPGRPNVPFGFDAHDVFVVDEHKGRNRKAMKYYLRKASRALTAVAAALVMVVIPAGSAVAGTTQLSGVASFVDECGGEMSDLTLQLEGDLVGCLYTTIETGEEKPGGIYIETGTEVIVACMDNGGVETCGTFSTTYRFIGKFADTGEQLFGKCHHPIVAGSGTDGFSGATGRLAFKDNVDTGQAAYTGHIKLP